ncbi:MAG: hypothetical protein AAFV33_20075, partial [Chloroflexota bacterium]
QLTSLPPEIGQLHTLNGLYLGNNQLTSLPKEIGQLATLRRLSVSDNHLTLMLEISHLPMLYALDVDNNPLQVPPPDVAEQGISAIREYFEKPGSPYQPAFPFWLTLAGVLIGVTVSVRGAVAALRRMG